MKTLTAFGLAALLAASLTSAHAQPPPLRELQADTWAGTDALGRSLPMAGQARPPHKDKFVGIFYFV